jgi:hypothetical protein
MGQIFAILGLATITSHVSLRVFTDDECRSRWRSIAHDVGTPVSRVVTDYLKYCCEARVWWQDRLQHRGYPLFLDLYLTAWNVVAGLGFGGKTAYNIAGIPYFWICN